VNHAENMHQHIPPIHIVVIVTNIDSVGDHIGPI
jgi:hypothetical protein